MVLRKAFLHFTCISIGQIGVGPELKLPLEAIVIQAALFGELVATMSTYIPLSYQLSRAEFHNFIDEQ